MRAMVSRGLACGATLAATTAAAMMIASSLERGSPWAGFNAMATAVGARRRVRARFDPAVTPLGIAVLAGGLLGWGLLYEGVLSATRRRSGLATGLLSGALAYGFDKAILPDEVVPEFRRNLGFGGTIAKYAVVGIASALSGRGRFGRTGEDLHEDAPPKTGEGVRAGMSLSELIAAGLVHAPENPEIAEGRARRDPTIDEEGAAMQRPPADS
ncbi:MAG: hypothetical protein QM820_57545 [Minicystis sp.]